MSAITVTAFTDTGLRRNQNEDAILVGGWMCQTGVGALVTMHFSGELPFVCAVADGMGGHAAGDLASRVALGTVADSSSTWRNSDDVAKTLVQTNDRIRHVGSNPDLRGLGTTIAGVCVLGDEVVVFNVGDSRVYRIDNGFLHQISIDDAVTDAQGRATNVVTQSLGQREPVSPHITVFPCEATTYLICSDGVSAVNSPASLRAAVLRADSRDCAESIIDATRANGADDNFSLILLDITRLLAETPSHLTAAVPAVPPEDPQSARGNYER
jgi:PPM family protein phosphatase